MQSDPQDAMDRGDAWMELVSGGPVWPLDLQPCDDVPIEDIACALSNLCRFGGHLTKLYSVAQHCVHVAEYVEKQLLERRRYAKEPQRVILATLMHDGTEGLGLIDLPRPVKYAMPQYLEAERRAEAWLRQKFNLTSECADLIKQADEVLLATEKRDLKPLGRRDWRLAREPIALPYRIVPWTPDEARARFLWKYDQIIANSG